MGKSDVLGTFDVENRSSSGDGDFTSDVSDAVRVGVSPLLCDSIWFVAPI